MRIKAGMRGNSLSQQDFCSLGSYFKKGKHALLNVKTAKGVGDECWIRGALKKAREKVTVFVCVSRDV